MNPRRGELSGIFYLSMSLGLVALFPSENYAIFLNQISFGKEGNLERGFQENRPIPLLVYGCYFMVLSAIFAKFRDQNRALNRDTSTHLAKADLLDNKNVLDKQQKYAKVIV